MNFNPFKFLKNKRLLNSFDNVVSNAREAFENDNRVLPPFEDQLSGQLGSGIDKYGPVYAAITLMTENLSRAPLYVGKTDVDNPNSQGNYAPDHPLNNPNSILNRPNPFIDKQTFLSTIFNELLLKGNAYCLIRRDNGLPVSLHLATRSDYEIVSQRLVSGATRREAMYKLNLWREDGKASSEIEVPGRDVLRLHWSGYNAATADSPSPLRNAINQSLKMYSQSLNYQYNALAKGPNTRGIVALTGGEYEPAVLQDIMDKLKEISGVGAGQAWQVFPPGAEYKPIDQTAIDPSIFNALNFSVDEVARIYHIPPPLIGGAQTPGMGVGSENLNTLLINNALHPAAQRLEEALFRKLLTDDERDDGYKIRLDLSGALSGTLSNRIQMAERAVKSSIMTPNEARSKFLNLGPADGGDVLLPIPGGSAPGQQRENDDAADDAE